MPVATFFFFQDLALLSHGFMEYTICHLDGNVFRVISISVTGPEQQLLWPELWVSIPEYSLSK